MIIAMVNKHHYNHSLNNYDIIIAINMANKTGG